MKLIDTAHAAGTAAGRLIDQIETAPTIVLIILSLVGVALTVLIIMWLFLPFAIYGLKKRLDEQTVAIEALHGQLSRMQMFFRNQDIPKLSFPEESSEPEI